MNGHLRDLLGGPEPIVGPVDNTRGLKLEMRRAIHLRLVRLLREPIARGVDAEGHGALMNSTSTLLRASDGIEVKLIAGDTLRVGRVDHAVDIACRER